VATTTTSATFTLPRDPVTKITGKAAHAAVTNLRKELCENAMSVDLRKADNAVISA
jgi:anthranilate/para-aminobenzoate synthase component I